MLDKLSMAEFLIGRYEKANEYASLGLEIASQGRESIAKVSYYVKSLNLMGGIAIKQNEPRIAIQCLEASLERFANSELKLPVILFAQTYLAVQKRMALQVM